MWNLFHYIFLGVVDFNSFRGIARIIIGILPRNRSKFPKKVWIYKKFVLFLLQKSVILIPEDMSCGINLSVSHSLDSSLSEGPLRKEIFQHKNRQRRGKEEKAALPVYENS